MHATSSDFLVPAAAAGLPTRAKKSTRMDDLVQRIVSFLSLFGFWSCIHVFFFLNHAKDLHVFILRTEEWFTARPLDAVGGKNELQINTDPP